jgi:hypothetical protein
MCRYCKEDEQFREKQDRCLPSYHCHKEEDQFQEEQDICLVYLLTACSRKSNRTSTNISTQQRNMFSTIQTVKGTFRFIVTVPSTVDIATTLLFNRAGSSTAFALHHTTFDRSSMPSRDDIHDTKEDKEAKTTPKHGRILAYTSFEQILSEVYPTAGYLCTRSPDVATVL